MSDVALRAETGTGEDGCGGKSGADLQKEALVVGGDADPGCDLWENRHRDIKELAAGKRICEPSGGCATALPDKDVVGGNDPSKRADALRGAAVRAKESERSAADEVLGKAVDFVCLESALEKFPFPVGE